MLSFNSPTLQLNPLINHSDTRNFIEILCQFFSSLRGKFTTSSTRKSILLPCTCCNRHSSWHFPPNDNAASAPGVQFVFLYQIYISHISGLSRLKPDTSLYLLCPRICASMSRDEIKFLFFQVHLLQIKKWLSLWDSPPEYSYRFKTLRPYTCQRAGKKPEKEMKRNPQKMGEWEKPALRRLSAYNTPGSYVRCFPGAVIATESDQKWNLFAPNSFWGRICVSLSLLFRTRILKRNII